MLTVQYAKAVPEVKFNAVEPGITATELGGGDPGSHPGRPAEVSAQVVVRLATTGTDGPTGTFQEDDGEPRLVSPRTRSMTARNCGPPRLACSPLPNGAAVPAIWTATAATSDLTRATCQRDTASSSLTCDVVPRRASLPQLPGSRTRTRWPRRADPQA
jgi:hypothetical protein